MKWASIIALLMSLGRSSVADADGREAKVHYERGMKAYNLQKFDVALSEFQTAYVEHPDPAFLFNIGQCQRQLAQYEAAAKSYRAYLSQQPDAPNRDEVLTRIADMEKGAQERRAEAPPLGVISPTGTTAAPVAPAAAEKSARMKAATPAPKSQALRNAGIGLGASGVAVLALGGAFAGLSKSAGDTAYHGSAYDYSADNRYHGYQAAEIASFLVGGAALATGTVLFAVASRGAHR
jgi:tetratricopeptide (TPR) repeat protein